MQAYNLFGKGLSGYGVATSDAYNDPNLSQITRSGADKYPNPFYDIASEYMPPDIYSMFELAEYLWNTMPPFAEVARKVISYFVTDLEFEGGDSDKRKDLEDFLNNDLKLRKMLIACGMDFMVYGQSFTTVYLPFSRNLICPKCGYLAPEKKIPGKKFVASSDPHYLCNCPSCGAKGVRFIINEIPSTKKEDVTLTRWNPKHIDISYHPISGKKRISLDFTRMARFTSLIKEGNQFMLSDTPWEMVSAVCSSGTKTYTFNPGSIYHMAGVSLAGMEEFRGWTIPPLLASFKLAYYIQLLRRYDEAFVMDFIMPFRVMFPKMPASGMANQDPLSTMPMGQFVQRMENMVARKRKNITDIQVAPFEIGYQLLGGEGKAMSPKDNIDQAMNELLNSQGCPAEFYTGNLQLMVAPIALRLFERRWLDVVDGYNDQIKWILKCVSENFNWAKDITAKLRSVTMADDLERKALGLQAAAGGDISKTTAYAHFGYNFEEEQSKILEEQKLVEKLMREAEEEAEISQIAGAEGAGADGGEAGGEGPGYHVTMDDLRGEAQDLAYQLLTQVPEGQRRGQLSDIKETNPTLHALVLQSMKEIRQQMASQGQAMLLEQERQAAMQGQGGQKQASSSNAYDSELRLEAHSAISTTPPSGKIEAGLWIKSAAEHLNMPSPSYIKLLILSEADRIDRSYMRKVAVDTKGEVGPGTLFSFICSLVDPTRGI